MLYHFFLLPFFNPNILKPHEYWIVNNQKYDHKTFEFPQGNIPNVSDFTTYENTTGVNIDNIIKMAEDLMREINNDNIELTIYFTPFHNSNADSNS